MFLPATAATALLTVVTGLGLGLAPAPAARPADAPAGRTGHATQLAARPAGGSVFLQTNDPAGNSVIVFARGRDGRLSQVGQYPTGGRGGAEPGAVVDPLASQGSLTYDPAHHLLFAVNAGSDTVTVFAVQGRRLRREQVVSSGGHVPVSVSRSGDLVYVLDAGGAGAISGYRIRHHRLYRIAGSTRELGLGNPASPPFLAAPSQVAVTPNRRDVVVATKTHGTLDTFPLDRAGRPAAHPVTTTSGKVPFALTFDRAGDLQVADASGGALSYRVLPGGVLAPISPFVANGQVATCWSVVVRGILYTANAGSDSITGYRIDPTGRLSLLDPSGVTARTDAGPIDLAASRDGEYLYQHAAGAGAIDEYQVGTGGQLTLIGTVTDLPVDHGTGPEGIAAD